MDVATISFDLDTTDPDAALGFEFWVDQQLVADISHVKESQHFQYSFEDSADQSLHKMKLVLKNKTWDHTKIDDQGNILKDAQLKITQIKFDDIELGQIFSELAQYHHQNNDPNGNTVVDKFYTYMGCNGVVSLDFSTPIYLWLLESM